MCQTICFFAHVTSWSINGHSLGNEKRDTVLWTGAHDRKKQMDLLFTLRFASVQSFSRFQLFGTPWTTARQASLSITNSQSLPKPMSIESVIASNHLLLCCPLSSCPQSFPASGSFQMSWLFTSGGQSTGVSTSTSVLPMNTQDWSPLGWTGWISYCFSDFKCYKSVLIEPPHSHTLHRILGPDGVLDCPELCSNWKGEETGLLKDFCNHNLSLRRQGVPKNVLEMVYILIACAELSWWYEGVINWICWWLMFFLLSKPTHAFVQALANIHNQ